MKTPLVFSLALTVALTACNTSRSISNSGYPAHSSRHWLRADQSTPAEFAYRGELSEFDVLGIQPDAAISEDDIQKAIASAKAVHLKPHSSILLVQSGAMFPDAAMVEALQKDFRVTPFSGIPPQTGKVKSGDKMLSPPSDYAKALRLAAARGGSDVILVYWGILESLREDMQSKTVSWVPVVGQVVPDEVQGMRIRIKAALIDVSSGSWSTFQAASFQNEARSSAFTRGRSDQGQVEKLKKLAYDSAANRLATNYGK